MNYRIITYVIGWVLNLEAICMTLPAVTGLIYGEKTWTSFLITGLISALAGTLLVVRRPEKPHFFMKEGCVSVALSWIALSLIGSLPFMISGTIPHFVDALFETVSGFTTTGASIMASVEDAPRCILMWIVSGMTAVAMIVAPYLGLDQLIRQLGNALKTVIRWLLLLIPNSPVEEETMATEQAQQAMPAVGNQAPWFLELFYKLLDLIGWMIGIGLVIACVFLVIRALYRLYLRFNEKTEENGDTIERLMPAPAAEKKKGLEHKKKEHLFWDRSTDGRIRKHYRKKVLEKLKESPDEAWTPTQTAREMELEPGEAEIFARIYEKARYGKDDCSREEMEKMLKIR